MLKIGLAVLDGDDAAGGEAAAVADAVDLVDDRHARVAGAQEVRVQAVHRPVRRDGAAGGDERLAGDLPAEDPLQRLVRLLAAEDVDLDALEVEQLHELVQGGRVGHRASMPTAAGRRRYAGASAVRTAQPDADRSCPDDDRRPVPTPRLLQQAATTGLPADEREEPRSVTSGRPEPRSVWSRSPSRAPPSPSRAPTGGPAPARAGRGRSGSRSCTPRRSTPCSPAAPPPAACASPARGRGPRAVADVTFTDGDVRRPATGPGWPSPPRSRRRRSRRSRCPRAARRRWAGPPTWTATATTPARAPR